jgi:hydrogenase-1 operon protein HyaF
VLVQESVFAGVWRVIATAAALADGQPARGVSDRIELGRIPLDVLEAAAAVSPIGNSRKLVPVQDTAWPEGVMNAPAVLSELQDHLSSWKPGQAAHIINCTLLPLTPQDLDAIHLALGVGQIQILSRGYGNCRITSTGFRHCWRVTYFNSQDAMILDTIELTDLPEVACAAPEDLADSQERLADLMAWVTEA